MVFKFQQGGAAPQNAQQVQQQIVALVQAAMQGDQNAQQQVQQIMEAAKNGDQQAIQIAQLIQQVVQKMQAQARRQKVGGKLDYIHRLRTGVNPDEEVIYEKCGGKMTKKVVKKSACGGKPMKEDGGSMKKNTKTYFEACGGKTKKAKKCYFGGIL